MPDKTPASAVFTEVILETFKLNGLLLAAGDILTEDLGLTSSRWQVLGALEMAGRPLTVPQIARSMGITRQGVQWTANHLADEGIVEFVNNPEHQRAKLLRLTPRGHSIVRQMERRQRLWASRTVRDLDHRSLKTALSVLRSLRSRLEEGESVLTGVLKEKPHVKAG
jgi:DNA-binding MarR family transcriptional regulator